MSGITEVPPSSIFAQQSGHPPELDATLSSARQTLDAILALAETAKSCVATLTDNQKQSTAAVQAAQERWAEITAVAAQLVAVRTQVADDQSVIATKSDHIQGAQQHADKVRGELDRALTAATQQQTEAEGFKARAQSASDTATELLTSVRTAKGTVETDAATVAAARDAARAAADDTRALADKANTIEERIAQYETALANLKAQCEEQLKTIVSLLPGATSAGLAHAFDERRQTFIMPRKRWQWLFVGSVVTLVVLASTGLWHVYTSATSMTYDDLLRLWLSRLPVAGALVWLALHAGRESALAKRLEEDYGYKAAVASSFQGFHKQMGEVGTGVEANLPLAKLCSDTLATIAAPPGRIYEAHKLTVTPATEITGVVEAALAANDVRK
jgi:hypothetical protein